MAISPFRSQIILDTGISMGDEGKGRLIPEVTDELTQNGKKVAAIAKVNGGANSGHTVGGLKLNLIPAGAVCRDVPQLMMGSGVVADPRKLEWECTYVEINGYEVRSRLLIDERTMVSDLCHRLLDLATEHYRSAVLGEEPRGSTGRGISPAFTDETLHFPVYFSAFKGAKDAYAQKLKARAQRACRYIRHVCETDADTWDSFFSRLTTAENKANAAAVEAGKINPQQLDFSQFKGSEPFTLNLDALIEAYWEAGSRFADRIGNVREATLALLEAGDYIIGEFGQAFWLDKRFGFAPNVTASHTVAPEFFLSLGIPIRPTHTFGVCKAYDTKVGTHVFLSQMPAEHPLSIKLSKMEFGVSTGRQRMVGWFDAVEKGDAIRYAGCDDLMINKLDALSYDPDGAWNGGELLICIGYRDGDQLVKHVPRSSQAHARLKPVYRQYPGWGEDISGVRTFDNLPLNAKRYVAAMVLHTLEVAYGEARQKWPSQLPELRYIGVGPEPSQIIKDSPPVRELIKLAQ